MRLAHLLALIAITCALGAPSASAQRIQIRSHPEVGAKCLDVPLGRYRPGARLIMFSCLGVPNQIFEYDAFTQELKIGGLCVEAHRLGAGPNKAGDGVGLWSCHGGANQRWRPGLMDATYGNMVVNGGGNNLCMDIAFGSSSDGAMLVLWTCHGGANQWFLSQPR